jgi:DNA-binding CsgD family transcriptional regulator
LTVDGLGETDARALLSSAVRGRLDESVRDRIVAETRGNPLALLELPRGWTPAELAGGFGLPDSTPLADRLEESFGRRVAQLPAETRRLLLVGAADPLGDPARLRRAAERLGIGIDAADAAARAGLAELGTRLRFRHPLVRSAIYHAASPEERRRAHAALAEETDAELDPDRHAWHRAHATSGLDEDVAAELERAAGRAQGRGGLAAGAAFLERAAELTPEPARRTQRALAAAEAKMDAGAFDAALELLATAEGGSLDKLHRARAEVLRAQIAFAARSDADAIPRLLEAARRLEPLDSTRARDTYLDAFFAASVVAGHSLGGAGQVEVAATARVAVRAGPSQHPRAADLLLDGLTLWVTEDYVAAAPKLKRALDALRSEAIPAMQEIRWDWIACQAAIRLWQDETWGRLSARLLDLAREAGALAVLPAALHARATWHIATGELAQATSLLDEAQAVDDVSRGETSPPTLYVAALRGDEHAVRTAAAMDIRDDDVPSAANRAYAAVLASAVLYNALGRYEEALTTAQRAGDIEYHARLGPWTLVELIEPAVRTGKRRVGAESLRRLAEMTQAAGTDWALGIEARSRALLGHGAAAEAHYEEAIERLGRTHLRFEHARAHQFYGEWLRRERRRSEAREHLHRAHAMFSDFGMPAFAERARIESNATGARARKRISETQDDLTPQEAQISRLAAEGATNAEIAARLFLSPSTIDYHLRKAFRKLGVKSRHQLAQHLP